MREITEIIEVHQILLGIAQEFDRVCRENGIQYMMLGGSMIGAIRHKGFIPWDDDMDFGVLREDYEKLKLLLAKELKVPYKLRSVDDTKSLVDDFLKIEDTRTFMKIRFLEDAVEEIGINIDIFPLDYTYPNISRFSRNDIIYKLVKIQGYRFFEGKLDSFSKEISRKVVKFLFRFLGRRTISNLVRKILPRKAPYLTNIFGVYELREVMPIEFFLPAREYLFEGIKLMGVNDYHRYLSNVYGDYMKLPPEEKRHYHIANVFMK